MSRAALLEERILAFLRRLDHPITQPELARRLGVDPRLVSRILAQLERRGVIRRERTLVQGRRVFVIRPFRVGLDEIAEIPCFSCPWLERCGRGQPRDPARCERLTQWLMRASGLS